jgi:hypothetical protein
LVSGVVDEVVATTTHWYKFSLASPYLDDGRSVVGEELVRAWFVKFVGSLHILAIDVVILGSS